MEGSIPAAGPIAGSSGDLAPPPRLTPATAAVPTSSGAATAGGVPPPPPPSNPHVLCEIKTQPLSPRVAGGKHRGGRGSRGSRRGRVAKGEAKALENEKPTGSKSKSKPSRNPVTVQSMWGTTDFTKKSLFARPNRAKTDDADLSDNAEEEFENEDDEDMAVVDTFADYKPSKLKIGKSHPDPVIETASMASVLPPNITYSLHLPDKVIDGAKLSALQLESITYACQQHEFDLKSGVRSGYLIGDGAGVGKGRTIAGIIYENWIQKRRKSIWVSVSADLKFDSERDFRDIGASMIKIHPLNKLKYGKISQFNDGVIFSTYSALIGHTSAGGKYNTRLKQLVKWCGNDFDGVIVFDECHRAKNLVQLGRKKPTKTGQAVHDIQQLLPRARVVYASATGASEPRNMAYMTRLGIWGEGTPFPDFKNFLDAIVRRGVGAMEIVAMDMKQRGSYIARQLSFKGVTFTIDKVELSVEDIRVYNESVALWVDAAQLLREAIDLVGTPDNKKAMMVWAQFWGAHQRFFKYLCIAAKVKKTMELAKAAVKEGKCAVIGLQSTGEARTLDQLEKDEGELTDFVSTAKGVFQNMVEKQFPGRIPLKTRGNLFGKESNKNLSLVDFQDGFDDDDENDENEPNPAKRKTRQTAGNSSKRVKLTDGDADSEDISDSEDEGSDFVVDDDDRTTDEIQSDDSNSDEDVTFEMDGGSDDENGIEDLLGRGFNKKRKKTAKGKKGKKMLKKEGPSKDDMKTAIAIKVDLLQRIENLGANLPPNTLDELINQLGGPAQVAEMTGRKGRVVRDSHGNVSYETRAEGEVSLEAVNLTEKDRFMKGEKLIAIISEAASSGISLQSDRRAPNQRRRVHITLELPWSADRAIQQFGRTHRSNQVNAPEYVFLISDLAGENRFASVVAKRLESLGALTHGDRRATESRDLSQFHIDNKYGKMALDSILCGITNSGDSALAVPRSFEGNFCDEMSKALFGVELLTKRESEGETYYNLGQDHKNISKFLNRILGVPVRLQNYLFEYFCDTLSHVVKQAKKTGRYDAGILDLSHGGSSEIQRVRKDSYERQHATGVGLIELHEIKVERGLSYEQALQKYAGLFGLASEGFYLTKQVRSGKTPAIFAISESNEKSAATNLNSMYTIHRPSTGMQWSRVPLRELREKYNKVTPEQAKVSWEYQYTRSETVCSHAYWDGNCKQKIVRRFCDDGLRKRTYHVLSGSVLLVWGIVEEVLKANCMYTPKMQIIRVRVGPEDRIVGILIPNHCAEPLREELQNGAVSSNSQGMGMCDTKPDMDYSDAETEFNPWD